MVQRSSFRINTNEWLAPTCFQRMVCTDMFPFRALSRRSIWSGSVAACSIHVSNAAALQHMRDIRRSLIPDMRSGSLLWNWFNPNIAPCMRPAGLCLEQMCSDWVCLGRPTVLAILQVLEHLEPDPEHVVG
jgi:hypothetical protein